MKLKFILQTILILSIFIILGAFYYSFFTKKNENKENLSILSDEKNIKTKINTEIASELKNIEYNSMDKNGNSYFINAKRAIIELESQKNNQVKLEGVISVINLKNKGILNIYSKNAIYNKVNHDTLFYNGVKIEYLDNIITSQNFNLIFSENISDIYNDVVFKNSNSSLISDQIIIDMETGDIKLEMESKNKKVRFINKS
tara:strand:+ start:5123 stop:5725 length:603 start_codon:yes stop_codon:yes gene_type:complete